MNNILKYFCFISIIAALIIPHSIGIESTAWKKSILKLDVSEDITSIMLNNDIVDQQQPNCNGYTFVIDEAHRAQSFQPQLPVLTKISLYMYKQGSIASHCRVSIRDDLTGNNIASCIKHTSLISSTEQWIEFDFNDITVNIGETYYLVISTTDGDFENCYVLGYQESSTDHYISGYAWEYGLFTDYEWQMMNYNLDLTFKTYGQQENEPPIADFIWKPSHPYCDESIQFDASQSTDPDGAISLYEWDWDNDDEYDEETNIAIVTHIWDTPGTYPITLQVTDYSGARDTAKKTIVITEHDTNHPPVASFSWAPGRPYINEPVIFNASKSIDIDGAITQYSWDWESDGIIDATTDTPTIQTTYATEGIYNITLQIQDDDDIINSTARPILISKEWTITVPDDYPTIQDAINHATSDDRIFVKSGTYYEHIIVTVDHVLLHGENKENTHLIATGNQPVIHLTSSASHVNISGFTIQGLQQTNQESIESSSFTQSTGIFIESDYNIIQDTIIKNHNQGITCDESYGNQIQETTLKENTIGIQLKDNTIAATIQHNTLTNNNEHGISIDQTSHGNTIYNNSIRQNTNYGIDISEVSKGNHISWNALEQNAVGIHCKGASDGNLYHHNRLVDNTQNAFDNAYDRWNSEAQGNYWSDYVGEDLDGDGVGDTPYVIPGGNNTDEYPLMSPPQHEKIDVAARDIFFSSVHYDKHRNYEITELREGDHCFITFRWDLNPDQCLDKYHWETLLTSVWLDNEFIGEGGLDPIYPWMPNVYWTGIISEMQWIATPGNHTIREIFDRYNDWDEANENNNELTLNFTVKASGELRASFTWNPEKPLIDETVEFDASRSYDKNYEITSYAWDWESDGIFDETQNDPYISHQWSTTGTYNITLQVTNSQGQTDKVSRMISILTKTSFIVPDDYATIQEAINHATDGMSIHVQPGVYTEHLTINKSIHLYGPSASEVTIDGGGAEQHIIRITADNVVISGFHIKQSSIGFSGIRVYSNNNGIYNNYITNCGGGIELYFTMNNDICNNILEHNHWGMYLDHAINEGIEENTFINNTFGLESGYSSCFLYKNIIQSNDKQGFLEIEDNQMKIHDNIITENKEDGVRLFTTRLSDFNNNIISTNTGYGITLHKSTINHIHDSTFAHNTQSDISLFFLSDENTIDKNIIKANTSEALLIDYSHLNHIYDNEFSFDEQPNEPCIIRIKADSTDNNVMHNIFLEHCQAFDTGENNWDLGNLYGGNYWVEHSSSDLNQDGFIEQPVNILGGGSQDHYPLLTPWDPPEQPQIPTGPSEGYPFKEYIFSTKTSDPTQDKVQYGWDWDGDTIIDEWTSYQDHDTENTMNHRWYRKGSYNIQVVARDEHGHISPWSQPSTLQIQKRKLAHPLQNEFISHVLDMISILDEENNISISLKNI